MEGELSQNCLNIFYRYSTQTSGGYSLVQGERRYVELLLREADGGDHVELTFLNPETGIWCPMTKMYLEQSHF